MSDQGLIQIGERYRFGAFVLDVGARQLERDGAPVDVQPKVFELLCELVRRRNRPVAKEELLELLWPDTFVTENVVARAVRGVRRALGDAAASPQYVKTLPKQGYRFVAPVTELSGALPRAEPSVRSIAVLPFVSIPPLDRSDGVGLAMAESLINRLGASRSFVVRPLRAVLPYEESEADHEEVGRALRIDAVVDGAVQQAGDGLSVTARLVEAKSGESLWSGRFDDASGDVVAIEQAIAVQIAASLETELDAEHPHREPKEPDLNEPAQRRLLRARYLLSRRTPDAASSAIVELERALDHDPARADAYLALAEAHDSLGTVGVATTEHFRQTRRNATRALALAPSSGLAHSLLGRVAWQHDFDWKSARSHLTRSIELAPNDVEVLLAGSDFACYQRDHERAELLARRAVAIDPTSPYASALLAQALYVGGRSSDALEVARAALELTPDSGFVRLFAGLAALRIGAHRDAIEHLEVAAASGRPDFAGALGYAYGIAGDEEAARETLAALQRSAGSDGVPPIAEALVRLGLGETEAAVEAVERSAEGRSWHVLIAYSDPLFEQVRSTGALDALFDRMGLQTSREGV